MCFDPVSIGSLTIGPKQAIQAGMGLVGAVGNIMGGQSQEAALERQAVILQEQAKREDVIANMEADRLAEQNSALLGRQRAVAAGNGIDLGSGTSLMLQAQTARDASFDEDLIRAGGDIRATRLRQDAGLTRISARQAGSGGFMRAGTTLLSTAYDIGERGGLWIG